jgi:hypothetical protein
MLLRSGTELLAHYNWLSHWAENRGLKRWNSVLKHHYTGRLCELGQFLHLRAGATFLDEDYMGRIKGVALKASGGGLRHTTAMVVTKWLMGTWFRWTAD